MALELWRSARPFAILLCTGFALFLSAWPSRSGAQSLDQGLDQQPTTEQFSWSPFQVDDYSRGENVGVADRDRPAYDATGIPVGGFLLFPKLEVGGEFDSNALAVDSATAKPQADWDFLAQPSVFVQSNWNRHELEAQASLNLLQADRFPSNNETGWSVRALGHYDLAGHSYVEIAADGAKQYIDRTDTDFPSNAAEVPWFYNYGVRALGLYERNRVRLTGTVDARAYSYGSVRDLAGGEVDESYRDFNATRLDGRVEYGLSPDFALLGDVAYMVTDSPVTTASTGPAQNSRETDLEAGANFDFTRLVRGEVALGYLTRSYQSAAYKGIGGPLVNAKVEYFPTNLLTLTFAANRSVVDNIFAIYGLTSPGYTLTMGRARADYELLRNLILVASVEEDEEDYQDIARKDTVGRYSAGAIYLLNRNVGLQISFVRESRDSSGAERYRSFSDNKLFFTLVLKR